MFTCGLPTQSRAPKRFATDTPRSPYAAASHPFEHAAQVITPTLSGVVMDVNPAMLFAYITGMGVLMGLSVAGAKHGDAILINEVVRREEATEAE